MPIKRINSITVRSLHWAVQIADIELKSHSMKIESIENEQSKQLVKLAITNLNLLVCIILCMGEVLAQNPETMRIGWHHFDSPKKFKPKYEDLVISGHKWFDDPSAILMNVS